MAELRELIREQVRALFGTTDDNQLDLTRPAGDAGLIGPGSVAWRVHGDLTAMMIGGTRVAAAPDASSGGAGGRVGP